MLDIRKYTDFETLRRDLTELQREFAETSEEVERYKHLFAMASVVLANSPVVITVRGGGKGAKLATLPQQGLNHAKIEKNFQAVRRLQQQLDILNNMIAQTQHYFSGLKTADEMLKEQQELQGKLHKELEDAYSVAAQFAKKQVPSQFKLWTTRIKTELEAKFKGRYKESTSKFMVAPAGDHIHFVGYILFEDLVDDSGFSNAEYYIIVTQDVSPGGESEYYCTLSNKFRLPNSYRFDVHADSLQQLHTLINDQIAADQFASRAEPRELPIAPEHLKHSLSHSAISNAFIKDNKIIVYLKRDTKNLKQVRAEIRGQLEMIFKEANPKFKDVIRDQLIVPAKGSGTGPGGAANPTKLPQLTFVLTLPHSYKGRLLNKMEMEKIKEILNLDDANMRKLQRLMDEMDTTMDDKDEYRERVGLNVGPSEGGSGITPSQYKALRDQVKGK